jgi:hypothetical protein
MLDGEELYKPSKGYGDKAMGKQAEFIEKYFGATKDDLGGGLTIVKADAEENTSNSTTIPDPLNLQFKKELVKMEKLDEISGSFFACGCKDNKGKEKQIYFYVQSVDNGIAYFTYCESFYFFKRYIKESGQGLKGDNFQGNLEKRIEMDQTNEDGEYQIKASKIKLENLINKDGQFLLTGKNFTIKYLTKYSSKKNTPSQSATSGTEEMSIQTCYTLCKVDKENTRYKLTKNISEKIKNIGGFPNIKVDGINNTSMVRK